jgi:hypothetical protein
MNEIVQATSASRNGDQALVQQAKPESPAPPSAGELAAEQQAVMDRVQRKANIIRILAFPAAMAAAVPVAKDIGSAAFKVYLDELILEAGQPTDPVEIMLLEQLTLAHHRVAQLHAQAEQAKSFEEMKIVSTAAARLTGEVRRLALALKQYREPSGRRQFTVVRQQNVSAGGQQVAYFSQTDKSQSRIPFNNVSTEQVSGRREHARPTALISESETASSRPAKPALARPLDAGGFGSATASGPSEQTVDVLDGTENGGGQDQGGGERSLAPER